MKPEENWHLLSPFHFKGLLCIPNISEDTVTHYKAIYHGHEITDGVTRKTLIPRDCLWSMNFVLLVIRNITGMTVDFKRKARTERSGRLPLLQHLMFGLGGPAMWVHGRGFQSWDCFDILRMTGIFTCCSHRLKREEEEKELLLRRCSQKQGGHFHSIHLVS